MSEQKQITFTFSVDQANYMLNLVAQRPYAEAKPIIDMMQAQAAPQLIETTSETGDEGAK